MSDQPALPTADAVETFVVSLRQRAVPLNTIKSYAHDLRLFSQAVPADLAIVTSEQIQAFLTSDEHHSAATRRRRYSQDLTPLPVPAHLEWEDCSQMATMM